jgi:hypothetical protein
MMSAVLCAPCTADGAHMKVRGRGSVCELEENVVDAMRTEQGGCALYDVRLHPLHVDLEQKHALARSKKFVVEPDDAHLPLATSQRATRVTV